MSIVKGSVSGTYSSYINYYLEYKINSQNIAENTSNITLHMYAQSTSNSVGPYNLNDSCPITIWYKKNNSTTNVINKNQSLDFRNRKVVEMGSWTGDIEHNSDGTLTLEIGGSFSGLTSSVSSGSVSTTWTLNTIPRASSFKVSNAIIGSQTTITISRANSNFKHTLTYSFGSLNGTIASNVDLTAPWTIPTTFYNEIPNSKKGNCTITCITYNGTTEIGRSSQTIEIFCNENNCIPDLTATIVDVNSKTIALTGNSSKLIKYVSTARITPKATAKNGAKISKTTVEGVAVTNYRDILNVNTNSFKVETIDSREYPKSITVTTEMIDYVQLTCKATIKRVSQTVGQVKLDYSGNYFNGSFGNTPNTLAISWAYREKGATSWTSLGTLTPKLTGNTYEGSVVSEDLFDYQKDYEFIIYVSDKLSNADINNISIYKSVPTFAVANDGIIINGIFFTLETFKNLINEAILERDKEKYPVGALVLNTSGTNPKNYLGFGTWESWGSGRVPVGVDLEQKEFNEVEKIGGVKEVTLTTEQMPNHRHGIVNFNPGGTENVYAVQLGSSQTGFYGNAYTNNVGENKPFSIVQPYITCYIWKRTA